MAIKLKLANPENETIDLLFQYIEKKVGASLRFEKIPVKFLYLLSFTFHPP